MGKITDIQKQKHNRSRVSVFIDGEFVCGLDEVAALTARLKIGDEITADELKKAARASELNSAFESAVGYISYSPRSQKETERYLRGKNYDPTVISETVDKLVLYRYIDDKTYAQTYIKSKSKKYGGFRLTADLRKKGVSPEIITELLDESGDDGIYEVARKYAGSHKPTDKQKLKRFLAGRGFSWDGISLAVARLSDEGAFDGDGDDFFE